MSESRKNIKSSWIDPDEIPDLSTPEWQDVIRTKGVVRRGRPRLENKKVLVTLRLDPDVIEHFKEGGEKNWQTRLNAALRQSVSKATRKALVKSPKTVAAKAKLKVKRAATKKTRTKPSKRSAA